MNEHFHNLNPANLEGSLFDNFATRQDGRGYSIDASAGMKLAVDESARAVDDSQMMSLFDSSLTSVSSAENKKVGIVEPGKNDCLTGRGGGTNYHSGNIKYRAAVDKIKDAYSECSRKEKATMSMKFVKDWKAQGGRFLRFNEQTRLYCELGDEEARVKVSQALREKRTSKISVLDLPMDLPTSKVGMPDLPTSQSQLTAMPATKPSVQPEPVPSGNGKISARGDLKPPATTQTMQALSILSKCFKDIGISDVSQLSGGKSLSAEEEFKFIKTAYFRTVLELHPDRRPNDHAAYHSARIAFEVLRSMVLKLRASNLSFESIPRCDLGYIHDLYTLYNNMFLMGYSNPSYEHYRLAALQESPSIRVELSQGGCDQCSKCKSLILAGDMCVGSPISPDGQPGEWQHMQCWPVPMPVWLGLTQPLDPSTTFRDLLSMNEVFITGLSVLDYASQLELVRYLMKRENWAISVTKQSNEGQVAPPLGDQKEHVQLKGASDYGGEVRPLKKRAVAKESAPVGMQIHQI